MKLGLSLDSATARISPISEVLPEVGDWLADEAGNYFLTSDGSYIREFLSTASLPGGGGGPVGFP